MQSESNPKDPNCCGCEPQWITGSCSRNSFLTDLKYEGVSESFRTGRLERELQMVQLSATTCSCIAILWVSLVSFVAITLCVASQRVFIVVVYFFMTQSGNFWIYPHIGSCLLEAKAFKSRNKVFSPGIAACDGTNPMYVLLLINYSCYLLCTDRSRLLWDILMLVTQLNMEQSHSYEANSYSVKKFPATGPYHELDESSPHLPAN
jgi:hypothetical protein